MRDPIPNKTDAVTRFVVASLVNVVASLVSLPARLLSWRPSAPHQVPRQWTLRRQGVACAAILAVAASLGYLWWTTFSQRVTINRQPSTGLGQVLARNTSTLLHGRGKIVLVVWTPSKIGQPLLDALRNAFAAELKKQGHCVIAAEEWLPGADISAGGDPEMGVPETLYEQWTSKYPDADAIVSFVGVPHLSDDRAFDLAASKPKLIAVSSSRYWLKTLFAHNILQLAIVPCPFNKPGLPKQPQTTQEWFDRLYEVITPQDVASLPVNES